MRFNCQTNTKGNAQIFHLAGSAACSVLMGVALCDAARKTSFCTEQNWMDVTALFGLY